MHVVQLIQHVLEVTLQLHLHLRDLVGLEFQLGMSLGDGLVALFLDDFELLRFDVDFALELHLNLLHLLVLVLLLQVHF